LYWPGVVGVPARYESTPLLPEKINIPGGRALTAGGTPGASVHVNGPVPVRMRRSIGNQNGEPTDAPGSSSSKLPSTSGDLAPGGAITRPMAGLLSVRPAGSVITGATINRPVREVVPDITPVGLNVRPVGNGMNDDWTTVYGGVPPAAFSVKEYGTPACPDGRSVTRSANSATGGETTCMGATRTVNTCSAKFEAFASSVARSGDVYVPGVVGAPTISVTLGPPIVPRSMRRPGGSDPPVSVHV